MQVIVNGVPVSFANPYLPVYAFDAMTDDEVVETVRSAKSIVAAISDHTDAWYVNAHNLYDTWMFDYKTSMSEADFWRFLSDEERRMATAAATKAAKKRYAKRRRSRYSINRNQLALALISSGQPHCCAECQSIDDITIDHIIPLSKGGGDEVSNLRFLCRSCNSSKGDKIKPNNSIDHPTIHFKEKNK